jgi:hypothetical protein
VSVSPPRLAVASLAAVALVAAAPARADAEAYLRVIAQQAPVHTGPGAGYRETYVAKRGEVFEVVERGTRGYWFNIRLDDGTTGWILGDMVYPFEVGEQEEPGFFGRMWRGIRRNILGPPPIPYADVEISFSAGMLDGEGLFLLRPSWIVDPYFAIDGFAGLSPRAEKDIFTAGLGWTLRLVPGAYICPYVSAAVGAAHIRPKADNFIDVQETIMALNAGGGIEITFKKQITLRLDARNWTLFDPDQANNGQEYSGGLAIFF